MRSEATVLLPLKILRLIVRAGRKGVTPAVVAKALKCAPSTVYRTVPLLQQEGFRVQREVERAPDDWRWRTVLRMDPKARPVLVL